MIEYEVSTGIRKEPKCLEDCDDLWCCNCIFNGTPQCTIHRENWINQRRNKHE